MALLTRTTALMASPTGRRAGRWARRHGAAGSMARAAPARATAARQSAPLPHPTTATQASRTGWLAGACRRSNGAARMQARAAHQQTEVALERCEHLGHVRHCLALAHCAIFRCLQAMLSVLRAPVAAHERSMAGCRAGACVRHLP